jgi:hypothetical protein
MDLKDGDEGGFEVVGLRLLGVESLHWESATGNGENWTTPEVGGEFGSVQCRRSTDQFEFGAAFAGLWTVSDSAT